MLGRNPAYIQQFVRRGVPKRLGEAERRKLARYFSISGTLLGGPADDEPVGGFVPVKRSPVRASAVPAQFPTSRRKPYFAFDEPLAEGLTASPAGRLSIIRVEGDLMAPTLNAGDDIPSIPATAPNRSRRHLRPSGGRRAGGQAARAAPGGPASHRPIGQSGLSGLAGLRHRRLNCIGRVIWAGRKIG